jgi:hypothetical protein
VQVLRIGATVTDGDAHDGRRVHRIAQGPWPQGRIVGRAAVEGHSDHGWWFVFSFLVRMVENDINDFAGVATLFAEIQFVQTFLDEFGRHRVHDTFGGNGGGTAVGCGSLFVGRIY